MQSLLALGDAVLPIAIGIIVVAVIVIAIVIRNRH